VVAEFQKYGLSKPLDNENCELTELGVEIGQGIGFIKHKENQEKKKSNKETIEKRKNAMTNFNYWFTRPRNIIAFAVLILGLFNVNTIKDLVSFGSTTDKEEYKVDQDSTQATKHQSKEKLSLESQTKQIDTISYNK
jgi:hypothetical protein